QREALLGANAANPRAAHPPREGDQQYLHESRVDGAEGGCLSRRARAARTEGNRRAVYAQSALRGGEIVNNRRSSSPLQPGVFQRVDVADGGGRAGPIVAAAACGLSRRAASGAVVSCARRLLNYRRYGKTDTGRDRGPRGSHE